MCDQFKQAEAQENDVVSTVMLFINDIINIIKRPFGIEPTPTQAPSLTDWIRNLISSFFPPPPETA